MPSFEADATLWTEENDDALSSIEAARLRGALFAGDLGDTRSHWDRLLNFRPEGVDNPVDMQQLLGTTESSAVDSIWLQQWSDVLTAYTDEVWGDLGPLAAEAKHEVDRLSSRNAQTQDNGGTMALNRLRQILAHILGNNTHH
ncbi:Solute carrier family 25 [Purpureocillium lavendulum]|uniref:Solute carrier family 25 n=1 Tax=Purpureocillium lavendulum TaxID=1247861 RepID=A0AB34G1K9_9HYPO|nr:Solute carrier family 25 [Purpureocillium lavendulum]